MADIRRMNGWVWGHTPPEKKLKFEALKCHFLHYEHLSKFAQKFMLTILVFEIKEGKNAEKIINNNNLSITY